jgi:CheY-like chemotaxis protein
MNALRLLIVEDNPGDLEVCRDTAVTYKLDKDYQIDLIECASLDQAIEKLDNSFDGAIIDLKLSKHETAGNQVVRRIEDVQFRIPVAILTGTPASAVPGSHSIGVFKKGETGYAEIFDKFCAIYNTGLTRIMGGRGEIEKTLNSVFNKMLMPQNHIWVSYGMQDSARTEKALLRHTLNHLLQLLDDEEEHCFPEEVYISPALDPRLQTGSLVERKKDSTFFVLLSPACDLVIRKNGKYKTDRILLAEIDHSNLLDQIRGQQNSRNQKELNSICKCKYHNADSESYKYILRLHNEAIERGLHGLLRNNHDLFHHFLPRTDFFQGGFINFRKLTTKTSEEFSEEFNMPRIHISPCFVKDIVARFSSYYARQGQPDIDLALITSKPH